MSWQDEWVRRWIQEGLGALQYPWGELPVVHESPNWTITRCWRRTACENRTKDSRIWVKALPGTHIGIEYECGVGQAFDHPNIFGEVNSKGYLWWYNAKRTPGRMSVYVDGELLVERIRFDLRPEWCGRKMGNWNAKNKPGQVVYDIEVQCKQSRERIRE